MYGTHLSLTAVHTILRENDELCGYMLNTDMSPAAARCGLEGNNLYQHKHLI